MRCFLAVPLAEPGLTAAQALREEMRARIPEVRWARPETLHLTVHFFGDIADDRAATAIDMVAPIAAGTSPFEVVLDRLGAFPKRGAPRVLWLGPKSELAPLTGLALQCRAALKSTGFAVEDREYNAHCTLGRPRMPWSESARAAWTGASTADQPEIRFTASRLVMYESRSAPGGAVYVERWSRAFAER